MISYKIKVYTSENKHFVKDGVLYAKPVSAVPMVGKDNRMYLSYKLGMDIEVPAGMVALILPPNDSSSFSVTQSGNFVLMPGLNKDVTVEYKINTDSIPRVFEQHEFCAQILFLSLSKVEIETVLVSSDKSEDKTEDKAQDKTHYIIENNDATSDSIYDIDRNEAQVEQYNLEAA